MRKILSFFAFVAIVISFAACGGNEPEVKGFTFKAQALSTKSHYEITAKDPNAYFYWEGLTYTEGVENTLKEYTEDVLNENSFQYLVNKHNISNVRADHTSSTREPDTKYIVWACYVEEDPETKKAKIISNIEYVIYQTMPEYTLNGEFTVDENGKKVRFMQANMQQASSWSSLSLMENQWDYKGTNTGYPRDLFTWNQAMNALPNKAPYRMLSVNEWYYLFKTRPNAEKLFAHACINGTNGVLLLPDNWQTPDGINLTPSVQMGMEWKDGTYIHQNNNFNGYEKNKYNTAQWETLEFAGAVFLPAAGCAEVQVEHVNVGGCYWSSTGAGGEASYLVFRPDALFPTHLYFANVYYSIRPVREIK